MKFRFPLFAIVLMVIILGLILLLLRQADGLFVMGGAILSMLAFAYAVGVAVSLLRFALGRAGVHRLAEAETWHK
jgi:hypothetical protein